ncbi:MAG: serine hydrolase domain-containing protein [Psychrobacillus psychrodurans]
MIKRILIVLILVSTCLSFSPVYGAENGYTPSGIPLNKLEEEIDGFVLNHIGHSTPGASIVVVKDGEIVFSKGYGYANIEKEILVNPQKTVFEYGSISKLFVWTAAMQLVEQGKLDLNADITTYLPQDFVSKLTYEKPITMNQIMSHTAGFEDYYFDLIMSTPENIDSLKEVLIIGQPKQIYEPSSTMAYSNYATALAGYVIESIAEQTFSDYEMEHIFLPLSMHTTSGDPTLANYTDLQNKANGYIPKENKEFTEGSWSYVPLYPAGSVNGTAEDLARFAVALMPTESTSSALFSTEGTLDKMLSQSYSPHSNLLSNAHGFWEYDGKVRGVGHGGNTAAFSSNMVIAPEEHFGVVVLTNASAEMDVTSGVIDLLFGKPDNMTPTSTIDLPDAEEITGLYVAARQSRSTYTEFLSFIPPLKVEAISKNKINISLYGMEGTYTQIDPYLYTLTSSENPIVGYILSKAYFEVDEYGVKRLTNGQVADYLPLERDRKLPWLIMSLGIILISVLYFIFSPIIWLIKSLKNRKQNMQHSKETKLFWLINLTGSLLIINNIVLVVRTIVSSSMLYLDELQLHIYLNWFLLFVILIFVILDLLNWKLVKLKKSQKFIRVFTIWLIVLLVAVLMNWNFFNFI